MSGYYLPWWGKVILAPVLVWWKVKDAFSGHKEYTFQDNKSHEEAGKHGEAPDPKERLEGGTQYDP